MNQEYHYVCESCGEQSKLTVESILAIDNSGVLSCSCGNLLVPDDEIYNEAKSSLKSWQTEKYCIYGIAAFAASLALYFQAGAVLPAIVILMGGAINKAIGGQSVEVQFKIAPQNKSQLTTFSSIREFKDGVCNFNKGFNPVVQKCCICQRLTKQTIGQYPVCGDCWKGF